MAKTFIYVFVVTFRTIVTLKTLSPPTIELIDGGMVLGFISHIENNSRLTKFRCNVFCLKYKWCVTEANLVIGGYEIQDIAFLNL